MDFLVLHRGGKMRWRTRTSRCGKAFTPRTGNFLEDLRQAPSDAPLGIVRFHLAQVAVVANVVARARLIDVGGNLFPARARLGHLKGFEDRTGIIFSTAE